MVYYIELTSLVPASSPSRKCIFKNAIIMHSKYGHNFKSTLNLHLYRWEEPEHDARSDYFGEDIWLENIQTDADDHTSSSSSNLTLNS